MSRTQIIRRSASALGVSAVLAAVLAAPASARQDDGRLEYRGQNLGTPTFVDDNAVEYLQIGAGFLAGAALIGAGAMVASRQRHAHPRPV